MRLRSINLALCIVLTGTMVAVSGSVVGAAESAGDEKSIANRTDEPGATVANKLGDAARAAGALDIFVDNENQTAGLRVSVGTNLSDATVAELENTYGYKIAVLPTQVTSEQFDELAALTREYTPDVTPSAVVTYSPKSDELTWFGELDSLSRAEVERIGGANLKFAPGVKAQDSRKFDAPAQYGGAGIGAIHPDYSLGTCSSGFTAKSVSTGNWVMLTAAHCYPRDSRVGTEVTDPFGYYFGDVVRINTTTVDASLIRGSSYTGKIWTGGPNGTTSKLVKGASAPEAGDDGLCRSGRTTGYQCLGVVVAATMGTGCFSGGWTLVCSDSLFRYSQPAGASEDGDSGAPVFAVTAAGSAIIRGTHSGSNGTSVGMFAQKWGPVRDLFDLELVIGN